MDEDEVQEPGSPELRGRSDQQIFNEQVAHASGTAAIVGGGLAILAALVMSTVALIISANGNTKTVTVSSGPTAGTTTRGGQAPRLTGDALGAQLFVSGKPSVSAIGCGSCHTMKAAGTTGTIGPNLDKVLTEDPASATRESIVQPNKEIVPGYSANVMPTNYGTALNSQELTAVVNYVYHSTNLKAKQAAAKKKPHP